MPQMVRWVFRDRSQMRLGCELSQKAHEVSHELAPAVSHHPRVRRLLPLDLPPPTATTLGFLRPRPSPDLLVVYPTVGSRRCYATSPHRPLNSPPPSGFPTLLPPTSDGGFPNPDSPPSSKSADVVRRKKNSYVDPFAATKAALMRRFGFHQRA